MNIDWDEVAAEADEGLPAAIGKLQRIASEGTLKDWLLVYNFSAEDGLNSHMELSDGVPALGLAEFAKHVILGRFMDANEQV